MCDRTMKMKLKKGSILQEVNSNTNSIELTVKSLDTKSFNYKKNTHVIIELPACKFVRIVL